MSVHGEPLDVGDRLWVFDGNKRHYDGPTMGAKLIKAKCWREARVARVGRVNAYVVPHHISDNDYRWLVLDRRTLVVKNRDDVPGVGLIVRTLAERDDAIYIDDNRHLIADAVHLCADADHLRAIAKILGLKEKTT